MSTLFHCDKCHELISHRRGSGSLSRKMRPRNPTYMCHLRMHDSEVQKAEFTRNPHDPTYVLGLDFDLCDKCWDMLVTHVDGFFPDSEAETMRGEVRAELTEITGFPKDVTP